MVKKECVGHSTFYDEEDYTENIFHRYQKRPLVLENLCLAEYVTEYEVCKFKDDTIDSDIDSDEDDLLNEEEIKIINCRQILKQLNSEIYIRRRLKSAVLKTPYLSVVDDANEYYYSLLVLYFPFRDESLIQNGHADIKQALLSKRNEIEQIDKNDNCLFTSQ